VSACPDVSIRQATLDDLSTVAALYGQLAPEVWNVVRDFPAILADPNAVCLIEEERGRPVGFVTAYIRTTLSCGRMLVVDEIATDRDHRGRGYGQMLVDHCIEMARERGLDCVELACSVDRPELHRFYEGRGFEDRRMRLYTLFLGED